jgi:hypothetical protein
MNISLNIKDTNYSLLNSENYKKDLDIDIKSINEKYIQLVTDYLKFIVENIKVKNKNLARFIIIRGLDTITNVFLHILYYTKNIDVTYFHCQKSFYFYVEFVGQITEEEKMFLQLTSRDATTYVYKKTVFEITNELKKINQGSISSNIIFINIDKYIYLYKTYLFKIIYCDEFMETKYVNSFINLSKKINNLKLCNENIDLLNNIVDNLYYTILDIGCFFDVNEELIKKVSKNIDKLKSCEKSKDDIKENYDTYGNSKEFIKWLSS